MRSTPTHAARSRVVLAGILAALVLPLLLNAAPAAAQDLLLKDAEIIDPARGSAMHGSVVIRGGKIAEVLAVAPASFDGRVVDASGKWVIPGLYDMHVHSFGNIAPGNAIQMLGPDGVAKAMLYCGVVGFLDLFNVEDQIFPVRDRQRREGLPGADIYCSGPILTCPGGHGTEYGLPTRTMSTPEEAERTVRDLALRKPDVVKIVYDHAASWMPTISHETMASAVRTANALGLKTVIHIGTWSDAREAVTAGASCITHVYADSLIPDDLIRLMREKNVYEIPTMTVETDLVNIVADASVLRDPMLAAVASPAIIGAYRDTSTFDKRSQAWLAWERRGSANAYRSLKLMNDGGVRLLAGTDVGNIGTFQGFSLHRELASMVRGGMTPWQALAAATTRAGEFLGVKVGFEPGADANLLVLDASPIADIANTQRIAMVIQRGREIDRQELLKPKSVLWARSLIDDATDPRRSTIGREWSADNDASFGGGSTVQVERRNGTMRVHGKLAPKKGMPGLAGVSLMFDTLRTSYDISAYDGVRLRIRSAKGALTLKMITASVTNYDFHAVFVPATPRVQELTFPFKTFAQLWSAPIPWTGKDVQGLALWVSGMNAGEYDFMVDSIELYKER